MGAGKTTLGEEVAERIGRRFVDLDREIEQSAGATIPEIFTRRGEEEFRELEQVARVADGDPVVDRLPRLEPEQLGESDERPPELAVRVDHDPAPLVRHRADVAEELLEVVRVGDEIRQHDVVEALARDEALARRGVELEVGVALLLVVGVQLVFTGLIGEMVADRGFAPEDTYSVREVI